MDFVYARQNHCFSVRISSRLRHQGVESAAKGGETLPSITASNGGSAFAFIIFVRGPGTLRPHAHDMRTKDRTRVYESTGCIPFETPPQDAKEKRQGHTHTHRKPSWRLKTSDCRRIHRALEKHPNSPKGKTRSTAVK